MRRHLIALLLWELAVAGWTAAPAHCGVDSTRIGYRADLIFKGAGQDEIRTGEMYSGAMVSARAFGLGWSLEMTHVVSLGLLSWGGAQGPRADTRDVKAPAAGRLIGSVPLGDSYAQVVLGAQTQNGVVSPSLTWRRTVSGRNSVTAGFRLRPLGFLDVRIRRGREHPLPAQNTLFYQYEDRSGVLQSAGGLLTWHVPATVSEVEMRAGPIGSICLESSFRDLTFDPHTPDPGSSPAGRYEGLLNGLWQESKILARYSVAGSWRATVGYHRLRARLRMQAYDEGVRFSHFGVVDADGNMQSLELDFRGWVLHAQLGHAAGQAKGVIEAWPFLNGLGSFLGERRHVIAEGDVDWRHISLTRSIWNPGLHRLNVQLDYLNVVPDLHYATWRPAAFGFGVDDLREDSWDIVRADLLRVQVNPVLRWNRWFVDLSFSQWIPIAIEKDCREQPTVTGFEEQRTRWMGFSFGAAAGRIF